MHWLRWDKLNRKKKMSWWDRVIGEKMGLGCFTILTLWYFEFIRLSIFLIPPL